MNSNKLYFYMALVMATAMPVLAQAQEEREAPIPAAPTKRSAPAASPSKGAPAQPAVTEKDPDDDDDLDNLVFGKDYRSNFGYAGIGMSMYEDRQKFSVTPSLGYYGIGKKLNATLGAGVGDDGLQLRVDALGVGSNTKNVKHTKAAFMLNGHAVYGTGRISSDPVAPADNEGAGTLNASATAALLLPALFEDGHKCAVYVGVGYGAMASNRMVVRADGSLTTTVYGPAVSGGGWCQIGALKAFTHNHMIINQDRYNADPGTPKNPSEAGLMTSVGLVYQFNQNLAADLTAIVDTDVREKNVFNGSVITNFMYTFGHGPNHAAPTKTSSDEDHQSDGTATY